MSDNNEQSQSSITEHLLELRSRIIKSLIFFALAFIVSYMNADKIYDFLLQPYVKALGEFVSWIFPFLFQSRLPRYESIAQQYGYTLDANDIAGVSGEADFIQAIADTLAKQQ